MNKHSTTETDILNISKKYISKNGLSSFNVRTITKECGISIGTLYNYFPSKSDLIIAAVESVWKEIFEPFTHFHTADCFPETVKCMYETMEFQISRIFFHPFFKFCLRRKERRHPNDECLFLQVKRKSFTGIEK